MTTEKHYYEDGTPIHPDVYEAALITAVYSTEGKRIRKEVKNG